MISPLKSATPSIKILARRFVIGIGLVSLFADFTYEGGHSILGPYLALLGAGPWLVGAVAGIGEFLGYAVRLLSGHYADRTRRHWSIMGVGYALNMLAVPALALASNMPVAAVLVFAERLGKGIRTPARDALLSQAGGELGHGYAFGLHEFFDQLGAFLGPLAVAAAVAVGGYRLGFGLLLIPALVALVFLYRARGLEFEAGSHPTSTATALPKAYYRYLAFAVMTVLGFAHFVLVAYHLEITHRLSPVAIPLLFALAMGVDALAALAVGYYFDRRGLRVLHVLPLITAPSTALLFLPATPSLIWLGAVLWGAALGVQESTMRAGVASLTPEVSQATAYGIFDTTFGAAWMIGSIIMGGLYTLGPGWLVGFGVLMQALALPLLAGIPVIPTAKPA